LPIQERLQQLTLEQAGIQASMEIERQYALENPLDAVAYGRFCDSARARLAQLDQEEAHQNDQLRIEQDRLMRVYQEQKVLEIYRDRKQQQALEEEEIQDQKQRDEMMLLRFGRPKSMS
jgi:flagellar biosynthesis chaperone FliJ